MLPKLRTSKFPIEIFGYDYFYGYIGNEECSMVLQRPGDYLLRRADFIDNKFLLSVAMRVGPSIRHFALNSGSDGSVSFTDHIEPTIHELIEWHRETKTSISKKEDRAVPVKRIPRPPYFVQFNDFEVTRMTRDAKPDSWGLAEANWKSQRQEVLLKILDRNANYEEREDFMKLARFLKGLWPNDNIVRIQGLHTIAPPLFMVIERCSGGSLDLYLREGPLSKRKKIRLAIQAAEGLGLLHRQGIIHRNIRARSCYMTHNRVLKIGSLSMARAETTIIEAPNPLRYKYYAPETVEKHVWNIWTDIYSYGILLWEIFSEAQDPFPLLTPSQAMKKVIEEHYRMDFPEGTPQGMQFLMADCWDQFPTCRPKMDTCVAKLMKELQPH